MLILQANFARSFAHIIGIQVSQLCRSTRNLFNYNLGCKVPVDAYDLRLK